MKYIVIGGNAAGMSFAAKLQRNQKEADITIFEKRSYISFGACGLPYYVGREFDDSAEMFQRTPEEIIASGLDLRVNTEVITVDFASKKVIYQTGLQSFEMSYDILIIATGAKAIIPPIIPAHSNHIHTLCSFEDGEQLRSKFTQDNIETIGILGCGFIGLEVMDNAHRLGKKIILFDKARQILAHKFSAEMVEIVEENIKSHHIDLRLNCQIKSVTDKENKVIIETQDAQLSVDLLVVAAGFSPNTKFLSGIEKIENGAILTDFNGKTSLENVYAIGDCATIYHFVKGKMDYIPLATGANKLGRSLADHLSGIKTEYKGSLGSNCIKVLDYQLGQTGLLIEDANAIFTHASSKKIIDKNQTSYCEGREDIMVKVVYDQQSYKLLGGEIVGKKDAVMRTNVLAALIHMQATTKELAYIDLCYSPPFARTWDVLNVVGNVIK